MSKFTIKSHPVNEADAISFGKAYHDFVKRCWTDHKPNYAEWAINFLLDCAHIANGTNVKGLPQQGFKLTLAGNEDLVGDCLHLQYSKDDGRKGVDVWLNPHTQKALVDLYGFNPDDPYSSTHKEFSARNYTADDFCEFIESLPSYKGESNMIESRKLSIRLHERSESRLDESDAYMDALDAELDEIVAAGSAQQQADKADELLKDEPKLNVSDKKYMDTLAICHKLGLGDNYNEPDTKAISASLGSSIKTTGKILKELVANGYLFIKKYGHSNIFRLTPDGEALLPPPPELDSRVPANIKDRIASNRNYHIGPERNYERYVYALNDMYAAVDKAGLGDIHWESSNGGWQWAYVKPSNREYYLIALAKDGDIAETTFNNPTSKYTQEETGTVHWGWPDNKFYEYINKRIKDIQTAYAPIKDEESKIYSYSFNSSNKNVKDKKDMLQVVENTQGTGMEYYTQYGFTWKGATPRKASYEDFREMCNDNWVDITVDYNTMKALVVEYSVADME